MTVLLFPVDEETEERRLWLRFLELEATVDYDRCLEAKDQWMVAAQSVYHPCSEVYWSKLEYAACVLEFVVWGEKLRRDAKELLGLDDW